MDKNGRLTISRIHSGNDDVFEISIECEKSLQKFVVAEITPHSLALALSGLASIPVNIATKGLDKVGKYRHIKTIEFEINSDTPSRYDAAMKEYVKHCPDGWELWGRFGSQNSFFTKDGKTYARTTIVSWKNYPQEKESD